MVGNQIPFADLFCVISLALFNGISIAVSMCCEYIGPSAACDMTREGQLNLMP
jgi:hypothetical protein